MEKKDTINIGRKDAMRQGVASTFPVGSDQGILFRIGEEFFAVRNRCPHQQFEKLHEAEVEGFIVTCPMHGWKFDLRTGASVNADGRLRVWRTEVRGNDVVVHCEGDC
ncbi:MAG: Rieske 2Fe-2S domain-containing protein [Bacteroidota bacterium]